MGHIHWICYLKTPVGEKSKLPVSTQTIIIAGSKKTIDVPTKIPI